MKKILCLILTLACVLMGLCSCSSLNKQPVTLADSISIPKNGIIKASVFETLKTDNKAVTFKGQSGDIRYEWIVFGSDIQKAADLNLGIDIMEADSEKITFRFLSKENFGFSPALSIYLNDQWDAESASVSADSAADAAKVQEAAISGSRQSILTFSPEVQTGTFMITPNTRQENASSSSAPVSAEPAPNTASDTPNATTVPETPAAASSRSPEISQTPESSQNPPSQAPISQPEIPKTTVPDVSSEDHRPVSDGRDTKQDKYNTNSVPTGKPLPAEPEDQIIDSRKSYTCTLSIECSTILNNLNRLESEKLDVLPKNGIILAPQTVTFYEGESVYDVLKRVCQENQIHMEASFTPMYNSAYVEGIGNLYEFDCGSSSGWMYRVDGWYPNYGCSRYQLAPGEKVEWRYTCDLGKDIGGANTISESDTL